jgi:hypothetical protein
MVSIDDKNVLLKCDISPSTLSIAKALPNTFLYLLTDIHQKCHYRVVVRMSCPITCLQMSTQMQKRSVPRSTTDQNEDHHIESPNTTTTINVNTTKDTIKPRKTSHLRKIAIALIIILLMLLLAASQGWLSSNVSNSHMFDVVRELYRHEEEIHPVLLPPTTLPPQPFWNVSVIIAKSSHLMDMIKSISKTTSPTFRVQVLLSGSITNATITKLLKKYHDHYLSLSTVRRKPAIGETLLLIPENLSGFGSSTTWLLEMYSQFRSNDKLIALGTRILYKTDTTPRYIYSAGIDVAYRELDTPVLFHRFVFLYIFIHFTDLMD